MANTQELVSQFKVDMMNALHAFGATLTRGGTTKDSYKAALYHSSATTNKTTSVYTVTGEILDGSYAAGEQTVTTDNAPTLTSDVAHFTPSTSIVYSNLTEAVAFDAVLIYNDTHATKYAVSVHTFGDQTVTAGDFTLTMPTDDNVTGLIRFSQT